MSVWQYVSQDIAEHFGFDNFGLEKLGFGFGKKMMHRAELAGLLHNEWLFLAVN